MKREGIPAFVWHLQFRHAVKAFDQEFAQPAQGLVTGVEPVVMIGWAEQCIIL